MNPQPKLRNDLGASRQERRGGVSFILKDPVRGRFYSFPETEHFIARQLDGATPVDEVRRRAEEKFGTSLSSRALEGFIQNLSRSGLLEGADGKPGRRPAGAGLVRGSLFYLRFKAFDPDRLLSWLVKRLGFLFTPWFVAFSAVTIASAVLVTAFNWEQITRTFIGLNSASALLLAWVMVVLVGMAHEFAHGMSCKRFGGEVRELGFLLMYFSPALYCNVSDVWLFPEKYKRVLVTLAGPFVELFLWAVATLTWRMSDPETSLNWAATVVMATTGLKTLFNLNPLIKLDGYYLLSDIVELPNLRKRSFRYVGSAIGKLFGARTEAERGATSRERMIFLVYGLVALTFTIGMLIGMVATFGYLVGNYQLVGLAVFLLLFWHKVPKRILRFFPKRSKPQQSIAEERLGSGHPVAEERPGSGPPVAEERPGSGPPVAEERLGSGHPVWSGRLRAAAPRLRRLALVVALVVLPIVLFLGTMELKVAADFRILPSSHAYVRAEAEGIVEEVLVREGDLLRPGDPIVRLSDGDTRAELEKLSAEIHEKQARLKLLREGPREEEIELARAEVEMERTRFEHTRALHEEASRLREEKLSSAWAAVSTSEEMLRHAQNKLARSSVLLEKVLLTDQEFDDAQGQVDVRQKEVEKARAELQLVLADGLAQIQKEEAVAGKDLEVAELRLRLLVAGSRSEEIEVAEAGIALAEAQRRYLESQMGLLVVKSPITGIVCTPTRQVREMIGRVMKKGDPVAEVSDLATLTAEIAVPEREIADVKVGQRVVLKARACPQAVIEGRVATIATAVRDPAQGTSAGDATQSSSRSRLAADSARAVQVAMQLENNPLLKPSMTGKAKICCGERSILELMMRRINLTFGVEFWSWW